MVLAERKIESAGKCSERERYEYDHPLRKYLAMFGATSGAGETIGGFVLTVGTAGYELEARMMLQDVVLSRFEPYVATTPIVVDRNDAQ